MSDTKKTGKSTAAAGEKFDGFTAEERAAMKDHAQELKKAARRAPGRAKADGESDVRSKIAEMDEADRAIAERVHEIVRAAAPDLVPRLWYGQPAYSKDGKVLCFFQAKAKFKTRYATLGFSDVAALDDGAMWPTSFALPELDAAGEARIAELVRRAAG
ncbi:iron chaperone [Actinomadura luteofluorescens]|uniref:Uncharacterized protein YdhG (YjbR/CyaY superfamily) n=1 Tax=Actinomadura luteofluorescens TaxID=46163 RepID=A0A7Y9JDH0_9ACTN|nr:DUF1801 domain-containing protein [Actinomadura luteofluorescens]NYD44361.1 uncharacterized protein YdhG (YjbR/CyaY superfamily) [Actinomadura luteofluorescens]